MQYFAAVSRAFLIASISLFFACDSQGGDDQNLIDNPGAEKAQNDVPASWSRAQVAAPGLRVFRATENRHSGIASLAIFNQHEYGRKVSNNWMQRLKSVPTGKEIKLSVFIRTVRADAANVCIQCWDLDGEKMLAFASTPVTRGNQNWTEFNTHPLTVPEGTASIVIRAALTGTGKAWFDDCSVSVVQASRNDRGQTDQHPGKNSLVGPARSPSEFANNNESSSLPRDLLSTVDGHVVESFPVIKDCMVLAYLPKWQHGTVDNIAVANNGGGVRTMVQWSQISKELVEIPGRKFFLALYSRNTIVRPGAGAINAFQMTDDWAERTSWITQPDCDEDPLSATTEILPGEGWKLFDVTQAVKDQAQDRSGFHGVMLRFDSEENDAGGIRSDRDWSAYKFVSREGLGEWRSRRPRLLMVDTQ